jgi:cytochrome bd-type quinol oxidase subunit 2
MKKVSNIITKVGVTVASWGSMLYLVSGAMAQSAGQFIDPIQGSRSGGDLIGFIQNALNLVIALAALISVGVLVYSGIQYIVASGDDGKIEKATKGITYAIIGLVICFISVLIVNFVLKELLKSA